IHAHLLKRVTKLYPIEEDLLWICSVVQQATGFRDSIIKRELLLLESKLSGKAACLTDTTDGPDSYELLLFALTANLVARSYVDIFGRVVDQSGKVDCCAFSASLQRNEELVARVPQPTRLRDHVEDAVAAEPDAKLVRAIDHVTNDRNFGRILLEQRDN